MLSLRVTLLAALAVCVSASGCDPFWRFFENNCYQGSTDQKAFQDARKECDKRKATLVYITSGPQNDFVAGMMTYSTATWTALRREAGGRLYWEDGPALTSASYTNWIGGTAPIGTTEECGYMDLRPGANQGKWGLDSCTATKLKYVCFKPAQ